jgi:murein DD-endopeptidase MepM/ murein hydrolase activator NlpD
MMMKISVTTFLAILMLVTFLPNTTYGSIFSIFTSKENQKNKAHVPQENMGLLSPALNYNPLSSKGGAEVVVENGMTIVARAAVEGNISQPKSDQISVYEVRPGDTLSQIAEMFDVSDSTIRWANDLGSNGTISPGDSLVILPVSGLKYKIKKGDTLGNLAKKYNANKVEIMVYNSLSSEDLSVGDEIIIPDAVIQIAPSTQKSYASSSKSTVGYYAHPVPGARKTQGIHGRNGVDFGLSVGSPIKSAAAGTVIISRSGGWNGGYGTYVVVKHGNGTQTLYAHNSSNTVSVGERVDQGDVIAYSGNTGKSTGPHLHFEVRGASNPF